MRSIALFLITGCIAALSAAPLDPSSDFANANPNGVWSYGHTDTLGGSLTLFTDFFTTPDQEARLQVAAWRESALDDFLGVYQTFTPGTLVLHPGATGQFSVLRFTVPVGGTYDIAGFFSGFDTASTDVHILLNGSSLFDSTISGLGSTQSFLGSRNLSSGSTLDFVVGMGANGTNFNDSTGLNLQLNAQLNAVPEPGTLGLMLAGMLGVFSSVRLRRRIR